MSDAPVEKAEKKEKFGPAKGLKSLPKISSPGHNHRYDIHNEKFAKEDQTFINACERVGVKPTARQASKFRNKKGKAYHGK